MIHRERIPLNVKEHSSRKHHSSSESIAHILAFDLARVSNTFRSLIEGLHLRHHWIRHPMVSKYYWSKNISSHNRLHYTAKECEISWKCRIISLWKYLIISYRFFVTIIWVLVAAGLEPWNFERNWDCSIVHTDGRTRTYLCVNRMKTWTRND